MFFWLFIISDEKEGGREENREAAAASTQKGEKSPTFEMAERRAVFAPPSLSFTAMGIT